MAYRARRGAGGLVRLTLAGLALAGLVWAAWWAVSQSLVPGAGETVARVVTVLLAVVLVAAVAVAERRSLETIAYERHRHGDAGARAVRSMVRVGGLAGYAAVTSAVLGGRMLAALSPAVVLVVGLALPGWVGAAGLGWMSWVLVLGGPVVAGWVVARAVTAWTHVSLRTVTAAGVAAGLVGLTVVGLVPLLLGVPMTDAAWTGTSVLGGVLTAGLVSGVGAVGQRRRKVALAGELASALGAAESTLESACWSVSPAGVIRVRGPLPAPLVTGLEGLGARLATRMPSHELESADPHDGLVLRPTGVETAARRQLLAETGGLIEWVDEPTDRPTPTVMISESDLVEERNHG